MRFGYRISRINGYLWKGVKLMVKVVYMGTPDFSVPALRALIANHDVVGVMTQPDRPVGRKGEVKPPIIKVVAQEHGIPVLQPEKIRKPEAIAALKEWDADVYVVAAFGQILPQEVLDIPPHGSINIHASLLPRWRGAAPIHAAIREGDFETGITIMKMDAGLDTGPILSQGTVMIEPDETGQTLHDKLANLGADLLLNTLPGYLNGAITPKEQPQYGITYAPQIKKEEGRIDWTQSAKQIERLVRAFTPWPGTFTFWNGKQLKIHSGAVRASNSDLSFTDDGNGNDIPMGKVTICDNQVVIGTGEGVFYPTMVQLAGKKAIHIEDFVRGYSDFVGSELGE